jgi:hypothetical protein
MPTSSLTLAADADAYVDATLPTRNFGTSVDLPVDTSPQQESFLKFTVGGVNGPITSATLRLMVNNSTTNGPPISLADNNWTETGIIWNNKPARIGNAVDDKGALSAPGVALYDVTSLISGDGTYTFTFVPQSSDAVKFNSREAASDQPQLIIVFSPTGPTATPTTPPTATPTATATATSTPTPAPTIAAGYRDFVYTTSASAPTEKEGQSKVWYAGGSWWGALFEPSIKDFYIYKLNLGTQTWTATGTLLDTRNDAKIDAFWDAGSSKLYIASSTKSSNSGSVQVRRFSFNGSTYTLDSGFPVTVTSIPTEDGVVTINKDGAGVLWMTFAPASGDPRPYVTHSSGSETSWVAPYVIPVAGTNMTEDDFSVLTVFGGKVGVMWSNQNDGTMYFAWHSPGAADSAWTGEVAFRRTEGSDDHINIKADSSGRVYAATKTSLNAANDPILMLQIRNPKGHWSSYTVITKQYDHTRPVVVINEAADRLYYFSSGPCCAGGKVYYKVTSLSNPNFGPGPGTPIIDSALEVKINNVSSTKQVISGGMGILIIAGDDDARRYLHNWLP